MTPDRERLAAAFFAECWPVCRELPKDERAAKRQADWEQRIELADRTRVSTDACVNEAA